MMERLLPLVNRKRQAAVEVEDNKVIASLIFSYPGRSVPPYIYTSIPKDQI